jgi:hypothetical protein
LGKWKLLETTALLIRYHGMETTALLIRYPEMGWVADQKESLMKAFRTFGERKKSCKSRDVATGE